MENKENKVILDVKNLCVNYGMIKAIRGISFHVNKGKIVALIGANGAGKTTTMHAISHLLEAKSGSIIYYGEGLSSKVKLPKDIRVKTGEKYKTINGLELTITPGYKIIKNGLSQVPEGRRVFSELSVKDNLLMGAYSRSSKKEIEETLNKMYEIFPILKERSNQEAGTLSGGEQQMLAVARALMSHPKVLLLDEPSMGLSPLYVNTIFDTIKRINQEGVTILVVEQNAKKALSIADRAYVIENGLVTLEGTGEELANNEEVKKAYLGQ